MSAYAESDFDLGLKKFVNLLGGILGFAGYWVARSLGLSIGEIVGVLAMAAVAIGLGWLVGRVASHRIDGDGGLAIGLSLSVLVAWMLPVLGFFIAGVVGQFYHAASKWKFLHLGIYQIGSLACFANALAGVLATHSPGPALN